MRNLFRAKNVISTLKEKSPLRTLRVYEWILRAFFLLFHLGFSLLFSMKNFFLLDSTFNFRRRILNIRRNYLTHAYNDVQNSLQSQYSTFFFLIHFSILSIPLYMLFVYFLTSCEIIKNISRSLLRYCISSVPNDLFIIIISFQILTQFWETSVDHRKLVTKKVTFLFFLSSDTSDRLGSVHLPDIFVYFSRIVLLCAAIQRATLHHRWLRKKR